MQANSNPMSNICQMLRSKQTYPVTLPPHPIGGVEEVKVDMWRKTTRQPNPKEPVYLIAHISVVMLFRSLLTNACTLGFLGAATTYSLGLLLFSSFLSRHFSLVHFVGCITGVTQSLFRMSLLARLCFFYFGFTLMFSILIITLIAVVFIIK